MIRILSPVFPFLLLILVPVLTSCGGSDEMPPPEPGSARLFDVSLDSDNSSLFFAGTATSNGLFNAEGGYSLWFTLQSQPGAAANDVSMRLVDNHGFTITQRARYLSDDGEKGEISLLKGRLILRGEASRSGHELEGSWYFDGEPGGTFWIAPRGSIFPSRMVPN
ncbi:MAG: hypothetical protein Q7Q71_00890 [Verrucomicrobiota bacterium JB023]|nr:hypothetical protein [Verrucomicrobiota bacterium JB023]